MVADGTDEDEARAAKMDEWEAEEGQAEEGRAEGAELIIFSFFFSFFC